MVIVFIGSTSESKPIHKKNKSLSGSFVALYFLVYDGTKGYNWKLDKIIGADSPNYNALTKEAKNQ
ncbi:hypothetical protein [Clostridium sp. FP1]|uniref:hypothetical protein n=1 Tax=Clostridium sp. FP1 TaxID=2724076 RepID=UPI0013E90889|nr:hypothetical protein [Clostridium sp. FP1]MBZ9634826.1 hypothetical protein [Clostridium sp. FP1]